MTRYVGNDGFVQEGNNTIAQVVSFDVTLTAVAVDASGLNDVWDQILGGSQAGTGTVTVRRDIAATGQGNLTAGATPSLTLVPTGTTGNETIEFTGLITSEGVSVTRNAAVDTTFQVTATGNVTRGTL